MPKDLRNDHRKRSALPLPDEIRASADCVAPTRSSLDGRFALLLPFIAFGNMILAI